MVSNNHKYQYSQKVSCSKNPQRENRDFPLLSKSNTQSCYCISILLNLFVFLALNLKAGVCRQIQSKVLKDQGNTQSISKVVFFWLFFVFVLFSQMEILDVSLKTCISNMSYHYTFVWLDMTVIIDSDIFIFAQIKPNDFQCLHDAQSIHQELNTPPLHEVFCLNIF